MKVSYAPLLAAALSASVSSALPLEDVNAAYQNDTTALLQERAVTFTQADLDNAKLYVQFVASTYCNAAASKVGSRVSCTNQACPLVGSADVINYAYVESKDDGVWGYIVVDRTRRNIVVAFPGTDGITSLITNIPHDMDSNSICSDCKLHAGWNSAWYMLQPQVLNAVAQARAAYPGFNVIATGHSQGGIFATITSTFLRQQGVSTDLYTYGAPKPGNEAFAELASQGPGRNFRMTHVNDPIPSLPPSILRLFVEKYRQISPEFWLSTGGGDTIDYSLADVKVCEGYDNKDCNLGTNWITLNLKAHSNYFQDISACK